MTVSRTRRGPARLRPTRFGVQSGLFWLLLFGAYFASPYSNLFFLLLAFLTLVLGGGLVAQRANLRDVELVLEELPPVPAGTAVRVPVRLRAKGRARFALEAGFELADGRTLAGRLDLLAGDATLELRADALPRGLHGVEGAFVRSSHPFGLACVTRRVAFEGRLVVYPAPRTFHGGRSAPRSLEDLLGPTERGAGDLQPESLRDHRDGDGVRAIHWRASARRGRLVVQEWEGASGRGLEVLLDRRTTLAKLEGALSTISAMVSYARTNKETLRLHSQGLSATFGDGHRPWVEALAFLAGADVLSADSAAPPKTSPAVVRLPRRSAGSVR